MGRHDAPILTIFRRELKAFERFRLETRLVYWDEQRVVMEQVFLYASGSRAGQIAAHALFKGGLYDRDQGEFLPIARRIYIEYQVLLYTVTENATLGFSPITGI